MSKPPSGHNRRAASRSRTKPASKVTCITGKYGLGPNDALELLDVSETGVRLIVQSPLTAGQEVKIGLEALAARRPTTVSAQVVWCVPLADGTHCIGARFDRPLEWGVLLGISAH